jgi:transposase-like protein
MGKGKFEKWLRPENLIRVEGWARDGMTDEQIAQSMGIRRSTLYEWIKRHEPIGAVLAKGKDAVDREAESALFRRAIGYEFEETTHERDKKGNMILTRTVKKTKPPDTAALIFFLKNRKPDTWRERQELGVSGGIGIENPFAGLSTDELRRLARDGDG